MKQAKVDCGFIRLTDSAVLIAALEMGFASEERLELVLHREGNWSSIRDKIALGAYPAAHMLSPMAIAMSLGLGPIPTQIIAPFVLSRNGSSLSATQGFANQIRQLGGHPASARSIGAAIASLSKQRVLRIGVPFPHSMHLLLSRYFLLSSSASPANLTFTVAPPAILPDVMAAGEIDLLMVGAPWGSVAVERGDTEILLPSAAIWDSAPEKVLGVRKDWADDEPETLRRLLRALHRAAEWCASPDTRATLSEILSLPRYLDVPADILERALRGELILNGAGEILSHPRLISLGGGDTNFPWRSAGMWIGDHAAAPWGVARQKAISAGAECFRSDLLRQALGAMGSDLPTSITRVEGELGRSGQSGRFFDDAEFTYLDE
ncbi:CmpA/NrtA family ABC transporter substrate-binding protein [Algicella marina]|uniref:Nitrate transporter n=1 Tax=Algicella marina TaxID=2683284 RepID=A0A6P1T536_9RHOB|nr:CmpA/NrtA family ABC transporter substrate-binding protein [Algicella marina]QHQ36855.1 nitrate transporter [Algicella marina]